MPSNVYLRAILGVLGSGLAVFGFLGVLYGAFGMMGLDGCYDGEDVCGDYVPRTFDQHAKATLVAFAAFLLGAIACARLARDS